MHAYAIEEFLVFLTCVKQRKVHVINKTRKLCFIYPTYACTKHCLKKKEKKRSRAMGNSPTPTFKQVNKVNVQEIAPLLQRCYVPAQGESLYWRFHDSHLTMEISVHSSFFFTLIDNN